MKKIITALFIIVFIWSTGMSQEVHRIYTMDIGLRLHGEENFNYSPFEDVDGKIVIDQTHVFIHAGNTSITLIVRDVIDDHLYKGYRFVEYTATDIDHPDKKVRFLKEINTDNRIVSYSVEYDQKVLYGFYLIPRIIQ